VFKPVWISEWIIVQKEHHPEEHGEVYPAHGWADRTDSQVPAFKPLPPTPSFPYPIERSQEEAPRWGRDNSQNAKDKSSAWNFPKQ